MKDIKERMRKSAKHARVQTVLKHYTAVRAQILLRPWFSNDSLKRVQIVLRTRFSNDSLKRVQIVLRTRFNPARVEIVLK